MAQLINFGAGRQFSASKSPPSGSCKPLVLSHRGIPADKKHLVRRMTARTLNIFILALGLLFDLKAQTSDTINFVDSNGKKQGQWIVTGKDKPGTCYKSDQKIEVGKYKDNRKTGIWTEYFCNGNIKNILTFNDGSPDGPAELYYEDGKIKEQGTWKANRWIGKFKLYTQDGKTQEFFFDEKGKRDGTPTFYPYEEPKIKGWLKNKDSLQIYDLPDKKIIDKNSPDSLYKPK